MKAHVEQTLKDIDGRIGELQVLRIELERLMAVPAPQAEATERDDKDVVKGNGEPPKPVARRTAKVPKAKAKAAPAAPARCEFALSVCEALRHVREPFGVGDIEDAAAINHKQAGNFVGRAVKKKWLLRTGRNEYTRGPGFPGVVTQWGKDMLAEIHK